MTANPVSCLPQDKAHRVAAQIMRDQNIGSVPLVADYESRKLVGMITDRDLCCTVAAHGLKNKDNRGEAPCGPTVNLEIGRCCDGANRHYR